MKILTVIFILFLTSGFWLLASAVGVAAPRPQLDWKKLADGIEYTTFSFAFGEGEKSSIHAFRVDPKKVRFDVALSGEPTGNTAQSLARRDKALIAINGGFFTPEHKSIGLIIRNGKEMNPIHKTSWWSIFTMTGDRPAIFTPKDFRTTREMQLALQVGPRLVVDGTIPKLKESVAARSGVGITKDGKVIIAISQGLGISMTEFAKRMSLPEREGGLECPNAMALDGGSSSQIYAKVKRFDLSLPNIALVTNALTVLAR